MNTIRNKLTTALENFRYQTKTNHNRNDAKKQLKIKNVLKHNKLATNY